MEVEMSEPQTGNSKPYDPVEAMRDMRDAYLNAVAKSMVDAVNTDAYAQATGAMLDVSLAMSAPFREALEKSMLQVLQQLSLPSRQDVLSVSERLTNLELRLDDMDASLHTIRTNLQQSVLPILQQLVLLTERVTEMHESLSAPAAKPRRKSASAKPASGSGKRAERRRTRSTASKGK
jgi:hypothetical protein